jgi:hypothetical protein
MQPSITVLGALALLSAAGMAPRAAQAQRAVHAPPPAPTLVAPADDPRREKCLAPDADQGIRFVWRFNGAGSGGEDYPVASYINIRRWEGSAVGWRPWVQKYANPPFTMMVRPSVYGASFAWRVWAVDRSGTAKPYATASAWRMFCTLPAGEPPPYGSSRPRQ